LSRNRSKAIADELLTKLQGYRAALGAQDAILKDAGPNGPVSGTGVAPIRTVFNQIEATFPGLVPQLHFHGRAGAIRSQVALACSRIEEKIQALNRSEDQVVERSNKLPIDLAIEGPRSSAITASREGDRIFIAHGRSLIWRELKDFLVERLGLSCDEFNEESAAGLATTNRLQNMLDDAQFAFLVMTAEDTHADGSSHARENVIHETGLFQGRLGFNRAIILLEKGCAEFSNIHGLTHISFPKGNIRAAFEEIRQVLEREGIRQAS
jgi:predicted nucleotide-binding protein